MAMVYTLITTAQEWVQVRHVGPVMPASKPGAVCWPSRRLWYPLVRDALAGCSPCCHLLALLVATGQVHHAGGALGRPGGGGEAAAGGGGEAAGGDPCARPRCHT